MDFVKDNAVVFRTCAQDHPIAFQIGTADPVLALKAAEAVYVRVGLRKRNISIFSVTRILIICDSARDVDAIDVNMGCPKHFSVRCVASNEMVSVTYVTCTYVHQRRNGLCVAFEAADSERGPPFSWHFFARPYVDSVTSSCRS